MSHDESAPCRAFNYTVTLDGTWTFRCEHCGEKREGPGRVPPCPARSYPNIKETNQ